MRSTRHFNTNPILTLSGVCFSATLFSSYPENNKGASFSLNVSKFSRALKRSGLGRSMGKTWNQSKVASPPKLWRYCDRRFGSYIQWDAKSIRRCAGRSDARKLVRGSLSEKLGAINTPANTFCIPLYVGIFFIWRPPPQPRKFP
ncbi:Uncharacterized protein HZ326_23152, partial [Fusarium oxysporum f. sp. albedinis]